MAIQCFIMHVKEAVSDLDTPHGDDSKASTTLAKAP